MLTKEQAPWTEYLVLDEETLESTLRADTPQEIREAYEKYNNGQMTDYVPTDADLQAGFDQIPKFPGNEI